MKSGEILQCAGKISETLTQKPPQFQRCQFGRLVFERFREICFRATVDVRCGFRVAATSYAFEALNSAAQDLRVRPNIAQVLQAPFREFDVSIDLLYGFVEARLSARSSRSGQRVKGTDQWPLEEEG
jgi:hypothetical protein